MATLQRLSIAVPAELRDEVRTAARVTGVTVSSWMAAAAADRLRHEQLGAALDAWEAEDGAVTTAERAAARRRLKTATSTRRP